MFSGSTSERFTSVFHEGNIEGLKETKIAVYLEAGYYVVNNARAQPLFWALNLLIGDVIAAV